MANLMPACSDRSVRRGDDDRQLPDEPDLASAAADDDDVTAGRLKVDPSGEGADADAADTDLVGEEDVGGGGVGTCGFGSAAEKKALTVRSGDEEDTTLPAMPNTLLEMCAGADVGTDTALSACTSRSTPSADSIAANAAPDVAFSSSRSSSRRCGGNGPSDVDSFLGSASMAAARSACLASAWRAQSWTEPRASSAESERCCSCRDAGSPFAAMCEREECGGVPIGAVAASADDDDTEPVLQGRLVLMPRLTHKRLD